MTTRQRTLLADGRELFYYDDHPGADRSGRDERDLPATSTSSQIRWDPLLRDWSVVAGHRQSRTYRPADDQCPLDPSRDGRHTEIPAADYDVAVFENRFPSFEVGSAGTVPWTDEPFRSGPGAGRCEVVCFTSDHHRSFSQLAPERVRTVVDALADRTAELSLIDSVQYIFCFENRGEEIGVTLSHPHGQIYGYPFVPTRFTRIAEAQSDHREQTGRCLQCDIIDAELADGARIVTQNSHFVAYVPFAARWPYEARLVPRRHVPDLVALSDTERGDLAAIYLDLLQRFDRLFDTPTPYIAGWQQAPVRSGRDDWHLATEVFTIRRAAGKLKYLAGSESGAGVWINDVAPEQAAARLRGESV